MTNADKYKQNLDNAKLARMIVKVETVRSNYDEITGQYDYKLPCRFCAGSRPGCSYHSCEEGVKAWLEQGV